MNEFWSNNHEGRENGTPAAPFVSDVAPHIWLRKSTWALPGMSEADRDRVLIERIHGRDQSDGSVWN
jgi:hypothetical protein